MTKTHWKTLPPWDELCAEILAEMEADALSPPNNVPSDPVMRKAFDDWDRRSRLIPWGSDPPELVIDEKGGSGPTDEQPLDHDGVVDLAMDLLKIGCSIAVVSSLERTRSHHNPDRTSKQQTWRHSPMGSSTGCSSENGEDARGA
jgi:hypothetical protein